MMVRLYTEIQMELDVPQEIITMEMSDPARSQHLANLMQPHLPDKVKITTPFIVHGEVIEK